MPEAVAMGRYLRECGIPDQAIMQEEKSRNTYQNMEFSKKLIEERDKGKAVLLVSLELEEVMNVSDRILVMYEGEIVGELDPKKTTQEELGLYMAGAKRDEVKDK